MPHWMADVWIGAACFALGVVVMALASAAKVGDLQLEIMHLNDRVRLVVADNLELKQEVLDLRERSHA